MLLGFYLFFKNLKFVTRGQVSMAVEKLTKARLIQIIITLAILVCAFLWRTFSYQGSSPKPLASIGQISSFCQDWDQNDKRVVILAAVRDIANKHNQG
ncbi:hypothetical protein G7083_00185 [Vibrio sp. HDW18]|uniref:hypothetical protein n=1 Tax=Vibrio sp. HDW18 TaxID=2714948 RepID=UPI00140767C3|nr:hypothetical protein [Vibrio sp. HDW18]QIL84427.1 hypothetical protein G7083_00185 [Vibrio sp. HDW18]